MISGQKQYPSSWKFYPKKPMRSFRDLEVYAKTLECAVAVASSVRKMVPEFLHSEGMINCALSIPLWIAEAHSIRFVDRKESIMLLEKAMAGCNKMVVYLEEAVGIYGGASAKGVDEKSEEKKKKRGDTEHRQPFNFDLIDELIKKYLETRGKIFRLEKSWQKWDKEDVARRV